jgi:arsenate reductase (glutaredoxin)
MNITIYHNPRCSKSRKTLELLKEHHVEPRIVDYLRSPPDQALILRLADLLGQRVEDLVRPAQAAQAGGLPTPRDDETVAAWLARNPAALQRPIVVDEDRPAAVVGRPPENVLDLLSARA